MAQCVISAMSSLCFPSGNCKRGGVPNPPGHGWATTSSLLVRSRTKAGRACRSSRHAVSPICTRATSSCSFGPSRTEHRKALTRSLSIIPRKRLSHPRRPMMSVWRDPEMPQARLARNTTASFPRPFSGHCPSSCTPLPPAYSCMRTTRYRPSVPGSPAVETVSHRLWGWGKRVRGCQVK